MLMGMYYCHGAGGAFYYKHDEHWGNITELLDAVTLEPISHDDLHDITKVKQRDIDRRKMVSDIELKYMMGSIHKELRNGTPRTDR